MIISPLRRSLLTLAATLFGCGTLAAQESSHAELNRQGLEFLNTHCRKCHHDDAYYPGLDILDRNSLLAPVIATEKRFLVAGNAKLSRIWKQVEAGEMPPAEEPQPSASERVQRHGCDWQISLADNSGRVGERLPSISWMVIKQVN